MNKLCIILATLLATSVATAQEQEQKNLFDLKPMSCVPVAELTVTMDSQQEKMLFWGMGETGLTMIFRNQKAADWYVIFVPNEHPEIACLMTDGRNSDFVTPPKFSGPSKPA